MGVPTYSLAELAKLADVTPRTIRFYIAQGLLPAPDPEGPKTRYTDEHLERIRAIKRLQAAHFPLAEIRTRLNSFTADELSTIADLVQPSQPHESAVDYIRGILEPTPPPAPMAARVAYSMPSPALPASPAPASAPAPATAADRSQWERISLDPDVELHVRRPLTRHANKRVERLIAIARELFKEEE